MTQRPHRFTANRLRWAIATALLSYSLPSFSDGLVPVAGPSGTPLLSDHQGVPALDIVMPDAQGISHNRFSDYNVADPGLVINNALHAGQAQLGPMLDANRHFQGQAASAIVMEVTGLSPSRIQGPQEIFGQRADYLLANPNGISLNGASFINANRASFLVGIPELEDGRIVRLAASHEQAVLNVGEKGASNAQGALELITPVLNANGLLAARDEIDVTLGHNTLGYTDRALLHSAAGASVDASLLGAMRAGRIRVVSTAEGAGVRIPKAHLVGRDGVQINARGDVHLSGTEQQAGIVSANQGDVTLDSSADLRLTALQVKADTITVKAGKALRLDTLTRERIARHHDQWQKKAWFIPTEEYSKRTTETTREHVATRLEAKGSLTLESGSDMHLTAATLKTPGHLNLSSGNQLVVDAALNNKDVFETVRHRKHLWRGDKNTTDTTQIASGSNLEGGTVLIDAGGDVNIIGSRLHSQGEGTLRSADSVTIDSIAVARNQQEDDFRGDLIGGHFFSTTRDDKRIKVDQQGSELRSESNLRIAPMKKAQVIGSQLSAMGTVDVQGPEGIELLPASETVSEHKRTRTQGFTAQAEETKAAADGKDGSKQYSAKVAYTVEKKETTHNASTASATQIKAGEITLGSNTNVKMVGATLQSESHTQVQAPQVQLLSSQNTAETRTTTSIAEGALAVTGGMDRFGSAFEGSREDDNEHHAATTHNATALTSNGRQQLKGNTLTNEGSSVLGKGETVLDFVEAKQIAVHDRVEKTKSSKSTHGSLGGSVEYTDLTRPIEKVVKGDDQIRFQNQAVEDNLFAPSVGADLMFGHQQRETVNVTETAKAPQVVGSTVQVNVERTLTDVGSQYRATDGQVNIDAGTHDQRATYNSESTTLKRLDVDTRARLDTTTGADANIKVIGSGGSIDKTSTTHTAVASLMQGKTGIQVQLGTDGHYEGADFISEQGPIAIKAGGALAFEAAQDRQTLSDTTIDGSAWVKVGNSPSTGKNGGGSAIGKYTSGASTDTQARTTNINTPGAVTFETGKNIHMDGTRIGTHEQKVARLDIKAGGRVLADVATDTHQADGSIYGGGVQLSGARNAPTGGKGAGIGGSLELGRTDEHRRTAQAGQWHVAGAATVSSSATDDAAIQLQGLQVTAQKLTLGASKGGAEVAAGQSAEQRNNKAIGVGLGFNGANTTEADKGHQAIHGRATLELDKLDSTTYANSQIRVDELQLNSRGDMRLSGVEVTADTITGTVAGDLIVESRQDQVNGHKVSADARLNGEKNPQGLLNGASALAGPAAGKVKEKLGTGLQKADQGFAPTLHLDVSKTSRDTASAQTVINGRDGIALGVEGDTQLKGAQLKSGRGQVDLGGSMVSTSTLSGSDHLFGLEGKLSVVPEEMTQNLINAFTGKPDSKDQTSDLGLIRTKGHDQQQTLQGGIKHKEG